MNKIIDFIKNHFIYFVAGVSMLILILIFAIITINLNYSAKLDVLVVPTDATVKINGTEYRNGLYENIHVGRAKVQISKEGFDSQEFEIDLKRDEETRIYTYLQGNDEWYNNVDEQTQYLIDIINEYNGEQQTVQLVDKYPIMSAIPIVVEKYSNNYTEYVSYRIDGGKFADCEQDFCLKITDISGGNYERALENIRLKGYNPDDYEIIYDDVSKKGYAG
ncbi:MAG: hypothetical protein Q4A70_03405 [Candidatus Saccharibacteria bacterium]|nr:hypothetical protein [Candidatus Saccharibacteria bacterium]